MSALCADETSKVPLGTWLNEGAWNSVVESQFHLSVLSQWWPVFVWPAGFAEVDVVALPLNYLPDSLSIWLRGFLNQVGIL